MLLNVDAMCHNTYSQVELNHTIEKIRSHANSLLSVLDSCDESRKMAVLREFAAISDDTYHAMLVALRFDNNTVARLL